MNDEGKVPAWRRRLTRVGQAGAVVLVLAFVLTGIALANGVHCLGCDRHHLTDAQFAFWERYFMAKEGAYGAATVLLAIASPFAAPRRWPFVVGLVIALFAIMLTPM